jgi:superfamily II DNA/RNA helicase
MPKEIQRLADNFMSRPERIEVSRPASVTKTVKQTWIKTDREPPRKRATLRAAIHSAEDLTNAIIFCNRKRDVAVLARSLQRHNFDAEALHGDMDQRARMAVLEKFRKGNLRLLVASDVAARGLDIPAVSHIFNFDVPTHSEDYVHRIGRTGRAGRSGAALTIVTKSEAKYIHAIEKLIGKSIEWAAEPEIAKSALDEGADARTPRRPRRGGRGKRNDASRGERRGLTRGEERRAKPHAEAKSLEQPKQAQAREDASKAVGFKDHVPAFLLRPTRMPREAEALEDA